MNNKYSAEFKKEVKRYWDTHTPDETCKQYSTVPRASIRMWCDEEHQQESQRKRAEWRAKNKESVANYNTEYFEKNKDQLTSKQQEWVKNNPTYHEKWREDNPEYIKQHYEQNRARYIENSRAYYEENRDECIKRQSQYAKDNRERINKRYVDRCHTDFNFKMRVSLGNSIRTALVNSLGSSEAKSDKTMELIGCDIQTFIEHIRSMYRPGMSDVNYGEWHLDHIKPCSSFDLTDPVQQKICFNYKNIQPLWSSDNIRKSDKLDASYSILECTDEYRNVKSQPGRLDATPRHNRNVLTFQPHFYEVENKMWNDPTIKSCIISNRMEYLNRSESYSLTPREILQGFKISGKYIGFSHFSPLWFKYFIEKYNVKTVYDPCGGWGHRLIGSSELHQYIYNDIDVRTVNGIKNIVKANNITNCIIYNEDSSKFIPPESYEAVFTCPPYYNVEVYNNMPFKDEDIYSQWWLGTINCSLSCGTVKYFAFVINDTYIDLLCKLFEGACLTVKSKHIEEIRSNSSHLQVNKTSKRKEYLVVYTIL